jgi:hypothetical protein
MKSITAEKFGLAYGSVAILRGNTKPEGALQVKPHGQTCIMPFFPAGGDKGKNHPGEHVHLCRAVLA